jgi:hypothetical protein
MRFVVLMVFLALLGACDRASVPSGQASPSTSAAAPVAPGKPIKRTVMLYMIGSDLESEGNEGSANLQAITRAKSSPYLNFAIQTGGAKSVGWDRVRRLTVSANALQEHSELGELNMGTADALADFMRWSAQTYPADEYVLVLWSHGAGSVNLGGQDYGLVGPDEVFADSLTAREIEVALQTAKSKHQVSPAMIGFDACLMGTVEVASLLRPYAGFLLASQELEPGNGWDYQAWVEALANKPEMTAAGLGKVIVDTYFEQYKNRPDADALTLSVVDLAKLEGLVASADAWAQSVMPSLQRSPDSVWEFARARSASENYGRSGRFDAGMVDMKDFVQKVALKYSGPSKDAVPADAKADAQRITSQTKQLMKSLEQAVAYTRSSPSRAWSSGLSTFVPSSFHLLNRDLNRTVKDQIKPLAMSPNWKSMLDTYRLALAKAPIPLEIHSVAVSAGQTLTAKLDGDSELVDAFFVASLKVDANGTTILSNAAIDEETALNGSNLGLALRDAQLVSLEGLLVYHDVIDSDDDFILMSIPAMVNDAESDILVQRNSLGATESFRVLGHRATGEDNANKRPTPFKAGDSIQPLYPRVAKPQGADEQEVTYVPVHEAKKLSGALPKVSLQPVAKRRDQAVGVYFINPAGQFVFSRNTVPY